MLYIRNARDAKSALSADEHLVFIKQCETYIGQLKTILNFHPPSGTIEVKLIKMLSPFLTKRNENYIKC